MLTIILVFSGSLSFLVWSLLNIDDCWWSGGWLLKDGISPVQFSNSVISNLCDSMDYSMPGFPVLHYLLKFAQTHVCYKVSDAIQPSHLLSSPSLPAFNLSQHHGLFKWISSSHQVAKVLEFQLQPSVLLMNIQEWFPLGWTGWISFQSKELSRVFSSTTVQKPQFFGTQLSL